jgi:hypothetical protein
VTNHDVEFKLRDFQDYVIKVNIFLDECSQMAAGSQVLSVIRSWKHSANYTINCPSVIIDLYPGSYTIDKIKLVSPIQTFINEEDMVVPSNTNTLLMGTSLVQ